MYQFDKVSSHFEKHIKHLIIYSKKPTKTLPSNFSEKKIWKLLVRAGILVESCSQVKFIIYDNEETIFYENNNSDELYNNFKSVVELIKNSYRDIIYFNDDPKTGWGYVSLNNSRSISPMLLIIVLIVGSTHGMTFHLEKDLPLVDYLNNPKNNNIWIITIVLPNMQHVNNTCHFSDDNHDSDSSNNKFFPILL